MDLITDEHVERAKDGYRRFRDRDPAFLDSLDPDVEWNVPETLPGGGALRGQLAVLEFFDGIGRLFGDAYPEPEEFLPAGDKLIVLGTWRGRVISTGARLEVKFAHVFEYRAGKVARHRNYLDTAKVLQSLEEAPAR